MLQCESSKMRGASPVEKTSGRRPSSTRENAFNGLSVTRHANGGYLLTHLVGICCVRTQQKDPGRSTERRVEGWELVSVVSERNKKIRDGAQSEGLKAGSWYLLCPNATKRSGTEHRAEG